MDRSTLVSLEKQIGSSVHHLDKVYGGDTSNSYALYTKQGRKLFLKYHEHVPDDFFEKEAKGLDMLRVGPINVPAVIAWASTYLVLEWIEPGTNNQTTSEQIGRGLAKLHRIMHDRIKSPKISKTDHLFGLDHDNYMGRSPQSNHYQSKWIDFFREERLLPQIEQAQHYLDTTVRSRCSKLLDKLQSWIDEEEAPTLVHGDLWHGNVHVSKDGIPYLIDPAVYQGHREVDIAMMHLFGGFDRRAFEAYEQEYALKDGHERRRSLYQLYPILVHVNLFGRGYLSFLVDKLQEYV